MPPAEARACARVCQTMWRDGESAAADAEPLKGSYDESKGKSAARDDEAAVGSPVTPARVRKTIAAGSSGM